MSAIGPERYRTRVPIFEPLNAKKLERPAIKCRVASAECRIRASLCTVHS